MTDLIRETSARSEARIAGALWLAVIVTGMAAFLIRASLMVRGDAAATAANVLAAESSFRLAFASDLVAGACYTGVTVILYRLLRPVGPTVALLAAAFGIAGVTVGAAISLNQLAPLVQLRGGQSLSAFGTAQLQAQALISLRLYEQGFNVSMVFFGLQCVSMGCLIARSTFLPRILGWLLAIGGSSYVLSSFATFLSPPFGAHLSPWIIPTGLVGEGSLCFWLLFKGVNLPQ
jgi:uncharacterized protein DUF4386